MKPIHSSLPLVLALLPSLLHAATFTTNTTISAGNTTYEGQDIVVSNCTLTANGPHSFNSLQLISSAILTHSAAASGQTNNQVNLGITHDVAVDASSRIDTSAKGYNVAFPGPGCGVTGTNSGDWGSGGGYGGFGADSTAGAKGGGAYGSITRPVDWGSAGGSCPSHGGLGGIGGGAVHLTVGGTLTIDGQVLANGSGDFVVGGDLEIGGGAGGSIWLTAGQLAGAGLLAANGGTGDGDADSGGGGGGRIAIYYGSSSFNGTISAAGTACSFPGGAGTIYTKDSNQNVGSVLVDNGGLAGPDTGLTAPEAFTLTITNGGSGVAMGPLTLSALHIATNGSLKQFAGSAYLSLIVQGDATIDRGGELAVDGKGYPVGTNRGPGVASDNATYYAGGAGYGGLGGSAWGGSGGGPVYGSVQQPVDLGSAGATGGNGEPGTPGGGAAQVSVTGTLTVNGLIAANGASNSVSGYHGGCGSGGSLLLTADTLIGTGLISANGGSGAPDGNGGAGGGGRIAIYCTSAPGFSFARQVTALGGGPFNWTGNGEIGAGAGTIYVKMAAAMVGDVWIGNGGNRGMMTPLTNYAGSFSGPLNQGEAVNLIVTNGAAVDLNDLFNAFTSLHISSNSLATADSRLTMVISNDAVIDAGGALTLDGKGYPIGANRGPGLGSDSIYSYAGGAGHGGLGGSAWNGAAGGFTYGSLLMPMDLGSAGATGVSGELGSAGGGAMQLTVNGTLTVDGLISANGLSNSVSGYHGGSGSGGSLLLHVGALQGTGLISANGGSGAADGDGGAGGGGRIAIYYTNAPGFDFAGQVTALGGGPFNWTNSGEIGAGAGTIYFKAASATVGNVWIGNGGNSGMLTPLTSPEAFNLTVTNNAGVAVSRGLTLTSLRVATHSFLSCLAGDAGLNVVVLADALIDSGGAINADGKGYPVGTNPGPGAAVTSAGYYAGGGGYGGAGGTGYGGSPGGGAYGSQTQPLDLGSAGGTGSGQAGTPGGGAIQFTVSGTLTLNGSLSANGVANPYSHGGSGSGGSIWLTAGTLQGTGTLSVIGGGSPNCDGGAGGGGRIAVYYAQLNGFNPASQSSAAGGLASTDGNLNGFPGTVYVSIRKVTPAIVSATPNGGAARPLASQVDLVFNVGLSPATFTSAAVGITTPSGAIPAGQITISNLGGSRWRVRFPTQTATGHYQYQVGPNISSLFGVQMAAAFTGSFDIGQSSWPGTIQFSRSGGAASIAMQSLAGMDYQLLWSADLVNWLVVGTSQPGDGTTFSWNLATSGKTGFYRMRLSETP